MTPVRRWIRRIGADESGATALEFAIIGSVFVIASMGIIEFGRSLQVRNEIAYAMDHGARTLLMDADATEAEIKEAIKARFNSYDGDKLTVTASNGTMACQHDDKSGTVDIRTLTVSYPLEIFIPGFAGAVDIRLNRIVPKSECVV